MLKLFVVALVVAAVAAGLDTDWLVFKNKYNKKYTPEMEAVRRYIWSDNKKRIEEHNKKFSLGLSSYSLGENEFADMTNSEAVAKMNGLKVKRDYVPGKASEIDVTSLPITVDWRTKGYVTEVKNEGQCVSGWAFSTTGSIEGQHFNATGKLVNLSESNLLDCSKPFGNQGCHGGSMENAFEYVIANKGIDTEASYPFDPRDYSCKFNASNVGATISSYRSLPSGSEAHLQKAVAEVGPISVAIDGSQFSFLFYTYGIYDEPYCSNEKVDHGVLVVGYGADKFVDYWLVKNNWGKSWGMDGYIMMSRNKNNQCGIASEASYPVV